MDVHAALGRHWPEYLIEAWALGSFMFSAATFGVLIDAMDSPVRDLVENDDARRSLTGIAMGLTAIAIIYSPWGKRSGAHMNPAVTLSFLSLGRIRAADAGCFVLAQFAGGLIGVLVAAAAFGSSFTTPPVSFVQTVPGPDGLGVAFTLEVAMAFGMMSLVLEFSNRPRLAPFTGVAAGLAVASYITFEAPYSGMSINPARTLASAIPAGNLQYLWLYFAAPTLGMLAAATWYRRRRVAHCAKLIHTEHERCIHCGYEPATITTVNTGSTGRSP